MLCIWWDPTGGAKSAPVTSHKEDPIFIHFIWKTIWAGNSSNNNKSLSPHFLVDSTSFLLLLLKIMRSSLLVNKQPAIVTKAVLSCHKTELGQGLGTWQRETWLLVVFSGGAEGWEESHRGYGRRKSYWNPCKGTLGSNGLLINIMYDNLGFCFMRASSRMWMLK